MIRSVIHTKRSRSKVISLPGQDVVVFGTGPLGLFAVQVARIMGAVNIVMVGLDEDVPVRFPVAKELGATLIA